MDFDHVTADFTYVRLLGDRKGIEMQTKVWDKEIVDRSKELWSFNSAMGPQTSGPGLRISTTTNAEVPRAAPLISNEIRRRESWWGESPRRRSTIYTGRNDEGGTLDVKARLGEAECRVSYKEYPIAWLRPITYNFGP
jgi:hypothetical protein